MIGNGWDEVLKCELETEYFAKLRGFVKEERRTKTIYPPKSELCTALELTPPDEVRVVILGQDPYINPGEAHGLAFSVKQNIKLPPSLKNIFKELAADIGGDLRTNGNLEDWAVQGVLLLNTVLTVESGRSGSHAKMGWEKFTDFIIEYLGKRAPPKVFIFWGKSAQAKEHLIDPGKHLILKAAHPSPLSANSGFFGCGHFSKTNTFLNKHNAKPIVWI